jgi:hypothetical protein
MGGHREDEECAKECAEKQSAWRLQGSFLHFSHLQEIAGTAFQSSAFSPTLFVGEKVAEGTQRGR